MNFVLPFTIKELDVPIRHQDKIYLIGSCFTDQIQKKFSDLKFKSQANASGILFNPISIANSLKRSCSNAPYKKEELFNSAELWHSFNHHSEFSGRNAEQVLQKMNDRLNESHEHLKEASHCIITLGSAFAWRHVQSDQIVANNHKLPKEYFTKEVIKSERVQEHLLEAIDELKALNPSLHIVFTISPVRHARLGLFENNLSKGLLHSAVHELSKKAGIDYFPAYELLVDVLRDYRFYKEDLVHPNNQAVNFIWEHFKASCLSPSDGVMLDEIESINKSLNHRPLHKGSSQHLEFKKELAKRIETFGEQYPEINFNKDY